MEKYTVFMDWKNQYSENEYTTLLGSSPGGSRVIRRGEGVGVLGKNLFNYRDIERLETDSVVGKLVEKKRLNNLVYVE